MAGSSHHASVWLQSYKNEASSYPALQGELEVDVAIVGAGFTGLSAALLLKRAGQRVAVLEGLSLGSGTSGSTTAHMANLLDVDYKKLISRFGLGGAALARESVDEAILWTGQTVGELGIDCGFRRLPGYLYTEADKDLPYLEEELEAARAVGVEARLVSEAPLPFPVVAAIRAEGQAELHPVAYLHGLAAAVDGGGSHVFEHTHVDDWSDGTPCRLATPGGSVTAQAVILATHTPLGRSFLHSMVEPYRSYVIVLRTRGAAVDGGLFWDTAEPYHYLRAYSAEEGQLVVLGGADHKTGENDEELAGEPYRELEAYARERFDIVSVEHRWSAQYYESADGLPYIGKGVLGKHTYMATGYTGDGTVFGTVAGMTLASDVLGRTMPWGQLYSATRFKPLASAKHFLAENLSVAKHLVKDWVGASAASSLAEVPFGEGRIVSCPQGKAAVYRDASGHVSAVSAVCTHLGCLVHWNPGERSWDCPCHGSRFNAAGEILEGPAITNLAPLELPLPESSES